MRSLVKLVVLLFCLQEGEGRRRRSLLESRDGSGSPGEGSGGEAREDDRRPPQREGSGAGQPRPGPPRPAPRPAPPARARRSAPHHDPPCGLRSVLLQARDLGLGYDSDESVLFKYCGGSCPHARSNHDLTLASLLLRGALPPPPPGEPWHSAPCCRPTHHDDVVFLDNSHRWHKVDKLSAAGCRCVG